VLGSRLRRDPALRRHVSPSYSGWHPTPQTGPERPHTPLGREPLCPRPRSMLALHYARDIYKQQTRPRSIEDVFVLIMVIPARPSDRGR